jgi:hypothetical protein
MALRGAVWERQRLVYITISLTDSAARALREVPANAPASLEVQSVANALGLTLEPMHPATSEPGLVRDFMVTGFSPGEEEDIRDALLSCHEVLGAYSKPPAEEPS